MGTEVNAANGVKGGCLPPRGMAAHPRGYLAKGNGA
jgi:hypothetical protein